MSAEPAEGDALAGLCASCRHGRRTGNARGSSFWQCLRAQTDASFARYPRLPVRTCPGYERQAAASRGHDA